MTELKYCKVCEVTKPLSDFPIVSGKAEAKLRRGSACKPCKAKRQAERRKKMGQPLSVQPNVDTRTQLPKRAYKHSEYEDWEVQKAISFFQKLRKLRDRKRLSGEVDW